MSRGSSPTESGRARLDRQAVIGTALSVADAEGLENLTIRRLAKQLGVTPMALYWHVADKQALLDALADEVWADALALAGAPDADDPWGEVRTMVSALVTAMRRHPVIAPLLVTRVLENESSLALTERALQAFGRLGYSIGETVELVQWLFGATVNLVTNHPGCAIVDPALCDEAARTKRARLLALPPERFPLLAAAADAFADFIRGEGSDRYFATGIELLVGAIHASAGTRERADAAG